MGKGTGVVLLAAGAILYWASDVDVPFVEDSSLGVILMLLGAVALVGGLLTSAPHPIRSAGAQTSVGTGIGLLLAGSILLWAVDTDLPYVDDAGLAVILIIAGIVTVAASVVMSLQQSRTRNVVEYRAR